MSRYFSILESSNFPFNPLTYVVNLEESTRIELVYTDFQS